MSSYTPPDHDCPLCPRLAAFREQNRSAYPSFFNAPVPSFGSLDAELLIVGLAPGLKGANQSGRPFTGDYAGIILYSGLQKNGFAHGNYDPAEVTDGKGDSFALVNCRVSNAVRCVPPENKPENAEIRQCNHFLVSEINAMPFLKVIVTLGQIAHKAVVRASGLKQAGYAFAHSTMHDISMNARNICVINTYHTSRYNINTGVLTQAMFDDIIAKAAQTLRHRKHAA